MNIRRLPLPLCAGALVLLAVSCAVTGRVMPGPPGETVLGTVQVHFTVRDAWFQKKEVMNMHVYIHLLEKAAREYSGTVDVRDMVWVTGRAVGPRDTEISAAGKVVRSEPRE